MTDNTRPEEGQNSPTGFDASASSPGPSSKRLVKPEGRRPGARSHQPRAGSGWMVRLAIIFVCSFQPSFLVDTLRAAENMPARAATSPTLFSETPPVTLWAPKAPPRAILVLVHGLGLHMGTYAAFAGEMTGKDIACYAIDVRGFGRWYRRNQRDLDFNGTIADVSKLLHEIHGKHPHTPIFLLGESMGGAIALKCAADNQDVVAGLISSVPSAERFESVGQDLKVGLKALFGGFDKPFDVGTTVIKHSTSKEDLRTTWENDPLGRKDFSPADLLEFQRFMKQNFASARRLTAMPVLVIQGAKDRLVRPTGTWDVYDHLATPDARIAFSKTGEHLIFEYGQFSNDDLSFVEEWIQKQLKRDVEPSLASQKSKPASPAQELAAAMPSSASVHTKEDISLGYWIELKRGNRLYRCNNKATFRSGDEIRFHLRSTQDGYAYIVLQSGSSGSRAVLFPEARTGRANYLVKDRDYALPTRTWLRFDEHPGTERLRLVFSLDPLDEKIETNPDSIAVAAFVSPDLTGAKDLVPTRMQLSWDDPNPVIMPATSQESLAVYSETAGSSLVRISQPARDSVLAVDVALEHR